MEIYRSLNRYWRPRRYIRIEKGGRKKIHVTRFHGGSPKGKKRRIRAPRRLRVIGLGALSPLKLWAKLKTAYVNGMLNLAGNVRHLNAPNVFGSKRIPISRPNNKHVVYSGSEIEKKLVLEIYKALQIVSADSNEAKSS